MNDPLQLLLYGEKMVCCLPVAVQIDMSRVFGILPRLRLKCACLLDRRHAPDKLQERFAAAASVKRRGNETDHPPSPSGESLLHGEPEFAKTQAPYRSMQSCHDVIPRCVKRQ